MLTKKKIALIAIGSIALCVGLYFTAVSQTRRTQKATDTAIAAAEKTVASADKAITKIYEVTKKKVVSDNASIQKRVENLDGDAVAAELTALLGEYRRERGDATGD